MANELSPTPTQTAAIQRLAYHIDQGPVMMYAVDAAAAVQRHPDEWSYAPWSEEDAKAGRAEREAKHKKAVEDAKAKGEPVPAPLPTPIEPTEQERVEMDADAKAREEAKAIVAAADKEAAERQAELDKIAAARALLQSTPPRPDPTARRPFGRKGDLTPAEKAQLDRRNADKAAKDKASGNTDVSVSNRVGTMATNVSPASPEAAAAAGPPYATTAQPPAPPQAPAPSPAPPTPTPSTPPVKTG